LTDRLFWTEERQAETDAYWERVRAERSLRKRPWTWWYRVSGVLAAPITYGALVLTAGHPAFRVAVLAVIVLFVGCLEVATRLKKRSSVSP
jgi:uncharacterized membrane protein HdeD (DUF308 family)